jgi:XTP/dITP diphosphohydrolase
VKLLIGTTNPGKKSEFERVLGYLARSRAIDLDLCFPDQLGLVDDIRETGETFEENSRIKARAYRDLTGLPALADDGGLEIDALGGEPGVLSRRWLGRDASDEELIAYALERMAGRGAAERGAQLRTCVTYADPDGIEIQECEAIRGTIALEPAARWTRGYPYRGLFVVAELGKYYDELTAEEHRAVNHRQAALTRLFDRLVAQELLRSATAGSSSLKQTSEPES